MIRGRVRIGDFLVDEAAREQLCKSLESTQSHHPVSSNIKVYLLLNKSIEGGPTSHYNILGTLNATV